MKIKLIYLIDDDSIVLMFGRRLINAHPDYEAIHLFETADEALDALRDAVKNGDDIPELILLDLNMPMMDGWDFVNVLQEMESLRKIPVAIVTSSIDPSDIRKYNETPGVIAFIEKPMTAEKLSDLAVKIRAHH